MTVIIYKILPAALWRAAKAAGRFDGTSIDLTDGYIHLSTAHQVRETAARHFSGQSDLVLVAVEADRLGEHVKWEPSRGGDLFPHLYGSLMLDEILSVQPLPLGPDGLHRFPDDLR